MVWVSGSEVQDILKVTNLAPKENLILNTVNLRHPFFSFSFFPFSNLSLFLSLLLWVWLGFMVCGGGSRSEVREGEGRMKREG